MPGSPDWIQSSGGGGGGSGGGPNRQHRTRTADQDDDGGEGERRRAAEEGAEEEEEEEAGEDVAPAAEQQQPATTSFLTTLASIKRRKNFSKSKRDVRAVRKYIELALILDQSMVSPIYIYTFALPTLLERNRSFSAPFFRVRFNSVVLFFIIPSLNSFGVQH